jgi:hypothetical protein
LSLRRTALLFAVFALLTGCDEAPLQLSWGFRFTDSADAVRARVIEATITDRGCSGAGDVVYQSVFAIDELAERPDDLGPGRYGLAVRARDEACIWHASGCAEVMLPLESAAGVLVLLENDADEASCEPALCTEGFCAASGDGGRDGGPAALDASGP